MDITDWQLWLDLFSTSDRRPGALTRFAWSTYAFVTLTPLLLGVFVLALTFVRPRSWVRLPAGVVRYRLLSRLGVFGPLSLLAVATICGVALSLFQGLTWSGYVSGAWFRAAVPFAIVVLLGTTMIGLRREPQPAVGERVIVPRHPWHSCSPRSLLVVIGVTVALYFATELWQAVAGPEPRELRNTLGGDRVLKNAGGAPPTALGWENHAASILGILLVVAMLLWLLASDASRPLTVHLSLTEAKNERRMTARLLCQITLGGILLALGTVWLHTWAPTSGYVELHDGPMGSGDMLISHYHGLVGVLRTLGWVLQGLGAGLLLRLGVDTLRARRAANSAPASLFSRKEAAGHQVGANQ